MPAIKYNVDMVSQQFSAVCWLACAAMLIQFKRRVTPSAEMLGISASDDFRLPQTVDSYTVNNIGTWEHLRRLGLTNARSSELRVDTTFGQMMIYLQLIRYGPFILYHHCGSFWYGPGVVVPTSGGHAVLIIGTDTDRGCVWFNNPWGTSGIMTTTNSIVNAITRWERDPFAKSISYLP